jgi:polyisoprenoid-binding protein YceI
MAQRKWVIDPVHSKIGFSVEHLAGLSDVEGQFNKYEGMVLSNSEDFSDLTIHFSMETHSIDTYNEQRDDHLRSVDFLDADVYPLALFESTSYKQIEGRKYELAGNLTLHGVTKPITMQVRHRGVAPDIFTGATRAGFRLSGTLNRKDFGITWNRFLDTGGVLVGDEITIICQIELLEASA